MTQGFNAISKGCQGSARSTKNEGLTGNAGCFVSSSEQLPDSLFSVREIAEYESQMETSYQREAKKGFGG